MSAGSDANSRRAEAAVALTGGLGSVLYSSDQLRAFAEPVNEIPGVSDLTPQREPQAQPAQQDQSQLISAASENSSGDAQQITADASVAAQLPDTSDDLALGSLIPDLLGPPADPVAAQISTTGSVSVDMAPQASLLDGPNVLNSLTATLTVSDGGGAAVNLLGGLSLDGLPLGGLGSLTAPVQAVLADTVHVVVDLVSGVTDVVGSLLSATSLTAPVGELVEGIGDTLQGLLGLTGGAGGNDGLLDSLVSKLLGAGDGHGLLNGLPLLGSGDAAGPDSLVGDVLGLTLMGEGEAPAAFDPVNDVLDVVGDLTGLLDLHSILDQPHGLLGGNGHIS